MANEEKGYWFSTEKGTHIHAEEGESKESAMKKRFSNFNKKEETKENSTFEEINEKRMSGKTKKHDYSEIFDEDYQRSWGVPDFKDENDIKTLNDIVEKAMEYDGEEGAIDISNNAMDRIGELTTFTEEEQDKLATGTGEEIMDILRSKENNQKWRKSLNIPQGHKPTKKELDKEVTDMFKTREEGEKFINETKWESEKDKQNAIDRLNRAFPKKPQQFKLDRKKYPDVETTPYGFIYNVNGKSITDIAAQNKSMGMKVDPNKEYGFTVTVDGDEVYAKDFDEAYKKAKGEKEKSISYDEFFESPSNKQIVDDYVEDFIFRARRNNEQDNVNVDKVLEEFKKDWVGFYSEETLPHIEKRIKEKLGK